MEKSFKKELDLIQPDALIDLKVSGDFYYRMRAMLMRKINNDPQRIFQLFNELKTREPKDEEEFDLMTLLTFVIRFEEKAYEQKLITKKTVFVEGDKATILNNESQEDGPGN